MPLSPRVYFAARSRAEIGESLTRRLESCTKDEEGDNREEMERAYAHYYGQDDGAGRTIGVERGGEQGELALVRFNNSRALAKASVSMVTGPKVNWRPTARADDASATAATTLALNLLETLWKSWGLGLHAYGLAEMALTMSEAFSFPEWDKGAGPPLGVTRDYAGRDVLLKQGDVALNIVAPWDVFRDNKAKSYGACNWFYVRLLKSRWDLARLSRAVWDGSKWLRDAEAEQAIIESKGVGFETAVDKAADGEDEDLVPVWYFFHKPTAVLPLGREVVFLSSHCVLSDSKLTYSEVPLIRLAADAKMDSPHAWTSFWDTLGPQEVLDAIETTLASIMTNLGNTNIATPVGTELKANEAGTGYNIWRYPPGAQKPEAINFASFPPDALKYRDALAAGQRQLLGLNDVALGQPQTAQMNAEAFAVLASMAVQQQGPFQQAWTRALEQIGTSILKTYARRVTQERMLKITGKATKNLYSESRWNGKQLEPVDAVQVEIGNPLEQTPAGRGALMQTMMQVPGAITSPEQVVEVATTGRLEPAVRATRDALRLLQWEYEQLMEGKLPPVHIFQDHKLHARENVAVLSSPQGLEDPRVVKVVQAHINEHYCMEYGLPSGADPMADPLYLMRMRALLGQLPPAGMAPDPMAAGGAPPPAPGGPPMEAPPELAPLPEGAPPVEMPEVPTTGEPFSPNTPPAAAAPLA